MSNREPTVKEVLDVLTEECAEVIHIISKVRRFGIDDVHPDTGISNYDKLQEELVDLVTMVDWVDELTGWVPPEDEMYELMENKRDKVRKYLRG